MNFTILFIDGNHENFPLLYTFPKIPFKTGTVRKGILGIIYFIYER